MFWQQGLTLPAQREQKSGRVRVTPGQSAQDRALDCRFLIPDLRVHESKNANGRGTELGILLSVAVWITVVGLTVGLDCKVVADEKVDGPRVRDQDLLAKCNIQAHQQEFHFRLRPAVRVVASATGQSSKAMRQGFDQFTLFTFVKFASIQCRLEHDESRLRPDASEYLTDASGNRNQCSAALRGSCTPMHYRRRVIDSTESSSPVVGRAKASGSVPNLNMESDEIGNPKPVLDGSAHASQSTAHSPRADDLR